MIEELRALFAQQDAFTELRLDPSEAGRAIQAVFASPEQLYAIVTCATEAELGQRWESAAEQVAVTVQSRLSGRLADLRWDIYLLFVVEEGAAGPGLRKQIENNRRYCRKIVLTAEDRPLTARLPLFLEVQESQQGVLFDEGDFLKELRACLPEQVAARLGDDFFAKGMRETAELVKRLTGGGEDDADSGA